MGSEGEQVEAMPESVCALPPVLDTRLQFIIAWNTFTSIKIFQCQTQRVGGHAQGRRYRITKIIGYNSITKLW